MTAQNPQPKPMVRSLACPNCGGTVQMRSAGRSVSVVCIQCLCVLDASTAGLKVLQQFQARERYQPLIPLGTRGKMRGDPYEVIGFQVREMTADGVAYHWSEYVLFNPYKGFRYLTEYNGHWNDVLPIHVVPAVYGSSGGHQTASHLGESYKHFQSYEAVTTFVMGEFPWKVKVGERSSCNDYISPPRLLSSERTGNESVWSVGEYTPGETIWKNFQLKGSAPVAQGIFANQPSPEQGEVGKAWGRFVLWLLALLAVQLAWVVLHANKPVFEQSFSFTQQPTGENSFVTGMFDIPGRTSNVRVELRTDLNNDWAFFQLALINDETGQAFDFSRQVSYYHGSDSDGAWTEGKPQNTVVLGGVPAGRYYLRVEPEMDTSAPRVAPASLRYRIKVIRDVTTWPFFFIGALLLLLPPLWVTLRRGSFETKRWSESDYGGGGSSNSDSGSED